MSEDSLQKLKPPLWASRLRRFLMRTCPLVFLSGIGFLIVGIITAAPWNLTIALGLLFMISMLYALFGLLLRLYIPLILHFTLGGLLATILTLGACVSALMSASLAIQLCGVAALGIGFLVTAHFSTQHELRYAWPDD